MSYSLVSSSGGTLDSYIQQLLSLERYPALKLESRQSQVNQKLAILSDVGSKLSALKTSLTGLNASGGLSSLHSFSVDSSDDTVLTATADSDASAGTHLVRVSNLARNHALASGGYVKSGSSFAAGSYGFDVTINGETSHISVTLAAGDNNESVLQKVAQAINLSGAEASASVVTSDHATSTAKLILTSNETGTENIISSITDTSGNLAATLGIAGTSAVGSYSAATTQTALDATFTLNGLSISSASNSVEDVLTGVTLDLRGVKTDSDITLKIVPDAESGQGKVEEFITKYNDVIDHLRDKLATSDDYNSRGLLAGSAAFVTLLGDLRSATIRQVSGLGSGALSRLADLGITSDREGHLKLDDAEKLTDGLSGKLAQVEEVLGGADGVATRLYDILSDFTGTNGSLDQERTLLNSQSKALTEQIERIDARLAVREKTLRAQYGRMLEVLSNLTSQQVDLSSYYGSSSSSGISRLVSGS